MQICNVKSGGTHSDRESYGLDSQGIESLPIPLAERSKIRVCGRLLVGVAVSNPAGAWIFLLCVLLYSKDKRQSHDNQDKQVQIK
jgi:hypothetical protein